MSWKYTAWKVSKYEVISVPYFPVLGLNKGKCGPEITLHWGTFHTVTVNVAANCNALSKQIFRSISRMFPIVLSNFFGKRENTKKTSKTAACFSSHNASVKILKRSVNFYVNFIKILLKGTEFFSKLFHFDKTAKVKSIFVFILLQNETCSSISCIK